MALYADETVLYTADPDFGMSMSKIRKDVESLSGWCNANGIRMNTDKTKLMLFGTASKLQKLPAININVDGSPLQTVSTYKYLGVTLDGQLKYDTHINRTVTSASLRLKQLRRMRSFLNTKAAKLVYKNMILPIVEYGDVFLVGASVANRKKLQMLQNKGLRCALNADKYADTDELHVNANILRLKYRRESPLMNLMFDMFRISGKMRRPN